MHKVGIYRRVRQAYYNQDKSIREVSRIYGLHRDTVRKMLRYSVPPGYQRSKPRTSPKLDPFIGTIDAYLRDD
ncbi:MAG: IS21 family transposase, partial [Candidatus Anammoxibacter sp.]